MVYPKNFGIEVWVYVGITRFLWFGLRLAPGGIQKQNIALRCVNVDDILAASNVVGGVVDV
jgi:hypothetical protein